MSFLPVETSSDLPVDASCVVSAVDGVVGAQRLSPVQAADSTPADISRIAALCATYGVVVHYDPSTERFEVTYV